MVLMSSGKRWSLDAVETGVGREKNTCRSLVGERKGLVGKVKDLLLMGI